MSLSGNGPGPSRADMNTSPNLASNTLGGALRKQFRRANKKDAVPSSDSHTLGALMRRINSQSPEPEQTASAPTPATTDRTGKKRKRKRDLDAELQAAEATIETPREKCHESSNLPSSTTHSNTEEVDLTLTTESFLEDFYTDDEAEEADREAARAAQKVEQVQETVEEAWSRLKPAESHARFVHDVLDDLFGRRAAQAEVPPIVSPSMHTNCKCSTSDPGCGSSSESDGKGSDSDADESEKNHRRRAKEKRRLRRKRNAKDEDHHKAVLAEIQWRRNHPMALHPDIIFNVPQRLNDGPACRCAPNHRESGVRHNYYPGEEAVPSMSETCNLASLHHYVLSIEPRPAKGPRPSSVQAWDPTVGKLETYVFSGLSLFFHRPLPSVFPAQPQTRFHDGFAFRLLQDKVPVEAIGSALLLDAFHSFLFEGVLELFDLKRWPEAVEKAEMNPIGASSSSPSRPSCCPVYHVMPRFTRLCKDGVTRLAPMSTVLESLRWAYTKKAYERAALDKLSSNPAEWEDFRTAQRGRIVINPSKRPCSLRVDEIEAAWQDTETGRFPVFRHHSYRLTNLMLMSRPQYPAIMHDIAYLKKKYAENPDPQTKTTLRKREGDLQKLRSECMLSRDFSAEFSLDGYQPTGLCSDVVQHALIMNVAVEHVRFHWALETLEKRIAYTFKDRTLLELSLSNPSYVTNCGTNADHVRAALDNCGLRDYVAVLGKKVPVQSAKGLLHSEQIPEDPLLRGTLQRHSIKQLVQIMKDRDACKKFALAPGVMNERLEFLGDVVVELIVTIHLFFLLPDHNEGALATFRSALVQNKNLASLAKKIGLDSMMLFGHGIDFCHEAEYRHALANSFEALMAAIYLDSGNVDDCERIFADAMFDDDPEQHEVWTHLKDHFLKAQHPEGDRHLIAKSAELQKLTEFEESIGLQFKHIRILARALTRKSSPTNTLTHGDNQSLELLGDTLLQFLVSDFLYKRYPIFHEGHLSVLRTCLVSNKTQSYVADDICVAKYIVDTRTKKKRPIPPALPALRVKDKADLVEALLGAIYVDRGWGYCKAFARVCFFPRLQIFIDKQSWNDPKSALQQACLALPGVRDGERAMPLYRQISKHGTSNNGHFVIAVSYRGTRIATGEANNIHDATMNAATKGLAALPTFFPKEWEASQEKKMKKAGIAKDRKAMPSRDRGRPGAVKVPPHAQSFNPSIPPHALPQSKVPSLLSLNMLPSPVPPPPPPSDSDTPTFDTPPPPPISASPYPQHPRSRAPLLPLPKVAPSSVHPPPKPKPQSLMDLVFDHHPGAM